MGINKRNYDFLIVKPDDESERIEQEFIDLINSRDLEAIQKFIKDEDVEFLYLEEYKMNHAINLLTTEGVSEAERLASVKELNNYRKYINSSRIDNKALFGQKGIVIDTTQGEIRAVSISGIIPEVKKILPDIATLKRKGNCHMGSYRMALNLGKPCHVVTGYIYGTTDKARFLHSWIETKIKGKEYVFDYTMNAIMNKDGYYLVMNPEPLVKNSSKTLRDDAENNRDLINELGVNIDEYLIFRKELMEEGKIKVKPYMYDEER